MPQYYVYSNGGQKFRNGIRDSYYVTDITLTVTGFAGAENTDWMNIDKVNIAYLNGAPSGLTLTVISDTEIQLDWTAGSTNHDGHSIERSTDNATWAEIVRVTGSTVHYHNTGLTAGTLYYYRVRAYKDALYSLYSNTASATTYEAELATYISGLATPLSSGQKTLLNTLIKSLKTGLSITSLSDVFDIFYVLAGETQESSLKNLVKNAHHCSSASIPAFVALEGFTSNGASTFLNTNYNPYTQRINYQQNNASLGVYSRTNNVDNDRYAIGHVQSITIRSILCIKTVTNKFYGQLNVNYGSNVHTNSSSALGLSIIARNGATYLDQIGYINKTSLTNRDNNGDTAGFVNSNMYLMCWNNAGTPAGFSLNQFSLAFAGKYITTAMRDVIVDSFEAYMDANGKGVI